MSFLERMQQEDKAQHIICAFLVVVLLLPLVPLEAAVFLVFSAGLLKEAWDGSMGTGFCWYDIAANGIGVGFAASLLMFV